MPEARFQNLDALVLRLYGKSKEKEAEKKNIETKVASDFRLNYKKMIFLSLLMLGLILCAIYWWETEQAKEIQETEEVPIDPMDGI